MKTLKKPTLYFLSIILAFLSAVAGMPVFASPGDPYLVGTTGSGSELTLSAETGYAFFSDALCSSAISGKLEVDGSPVEIFIKAVNPNLQVTYTISSVSVYDETGTTSSVVAVQTADPEIWSLSFPADLGTNQVIAVHASASSVNAPGGLLEASLTAEQAAALFDESAASPATASTANVTVVKYVSDGISIFTATVKNNLSLQSMITLGENVTLQIVSGGGDYSIKRAFGYGVATSYMFNVPYSSASLILGSGTVANDTITYNYNTNESETWDIGDNTSLTPSEGTKYVTYTTSNAVLTATMTGSLTIDGGAFLRPYTGTGFSFDSYLLESSDTPDYLRSTGNMINVNLGSVEMWDGVILQNNKTPGEDQYGGSAVNVNNASFRMYGGIIRRCVNSKTRIGLSVQYVGSSYSDGGAVLLRGVNTKAFFYDGEITQCESDNSSAISQWEQSTVFFIGGSIHNNFSYGDSEYPAQAISVYCAGGNGSFLYMYGGTIRDNKGINNLADIRISSGLNILHLFGGTIEKLGSNTADNKIYIYDGQVSTLMGKTGPIDPECVTYVGNASNIITIPEAIRADGSQTANVTVEAYGEVVKTFQINGTGTSTNPQSNLSFFISNGIYTITVVSSSMTKTYSVEVSDADATAIPVSRVMTAPTIYQQMTNGLWLNTAGTGSSSDGTISYGVSDTRDSAQAVWSANPQIQCTYSTPHYFYVKAAASGIFPESISPALEFTLVAPTLYIEQDEISINKGGTYTIVPVVTPSGFPSQNITWSISGNHSGTYVEKNSSGCTVTVGVNESAVYFTVTASLNDDYGSLICSDSIIFRISANETVNPPVFISHDSLTQSLYYGSSFTMSVTVQTIQALTYSYQWYESADRSASTSADDVAVGTDSHSLTVSDNPIPASHYYYCRVTVTNGAGISTGGTSNIFTATVSPRPVSFTGEELQKSYDRTPLSASDNPSQIPSSGTLAAGHAATVTPLSRTAVGSSPSVRVIIHDEQARDVSSCYAITVHGNLNVMEVATTAEKRAFGILSDSLSDDVTAQTNGQFTVKLVMKYTYSATDALNLRFSSALPAGTSVIMTDYSNPTYSFYYLTLSSSTAANSPIYFTSFRKAGTSVAFAEDTSAYKTEKTYQFTVTLPKNNTAETDGARLAVYFGASDSRIGVNYTLVSSPETASLSLGAVTTGHRSLSVPVTVTSDCTAKHKTLAVMLLDGNDNAIPFTDTIKMTLNGAMPSAIRDGAVLFDLGSSPRDNEVFTVLCDGLNTGRYKLKATVYLTESEEALYPSDSQYQTATSYAVDVYSSKYELKVAPEQGNQRIADGNAGTSLKFTLTYSVEDHPVSSVVPTAVVMKKSGSVYSDVAAPWQIDGLNSIALSDGDGSGSLTEVTVNVPVGTASGTYRIVFSLGLASIPFNIIVK